MTPHAMALTQRTQARRALLEARAASERLEAARSRAERLLQALGERGGEGDDEAGHGLRARMRQIESRMRASEVLMRTAELRQGPSPVADDTSGARDPSRRPDASGRADPERIGHAGEPGSADEDPDVGPVVR